MIISTALMFENDKKWEPVSSFYFANYRPCWGVAGISGEMPELDPPEGLNKHGRM